MTMYRNFGVELELYNLNVESAARALANAGIDARAEQYNHQTRTWWKVVTDCSIQDANGRTHYDGALTCEVVSPILSGEAGLEELAKVCKVLLAAGGKVNKSCGLHVHINARGLDPKTFAMTAIRYAKHEKVIDSFMPISRRDNNNDRYCASIINRTNSHYTNIVNAATPRDVHAAFGGRFYKLNFESYLRHGTIEFRHHSGSLNHEKVTNWVRFCQNFIETSNNLVSECYRTVAPVQTRANRIQYLEPRRGRPCNPLAIEVINAYRTLSAQNGNNEIYVPTLMGLTRTRNARRIPAAILNSLKTRGYNIRNTGYGRRWIVISNPEHVGFTENEVNQVPGGLTPMGAAAAARPTVTFTLPENDSCFNGLETSIVSYYEERIADLAA